MRVLFISAEVAPFAKVGGLADVAGGLPKALVKQGVDCRVIMPLYKMIETDPRWSLKQIKARFEVKMNQEWTQSASLWEYEHDGVLHYFIGCDRWFSNAVDSSTLYQPGGDLHAFFAAAVFRACEELGWIPEVLHANDWHTGFVPVLLRERGEAKWANTASVFTIHNLAYQGEFDIDALDWLNLPHHLFNYHQVEAWGRVNFLKAGMSFAEKVNTVSPTYAAQIQTREYGCALEGMTQFLADNGRLSGILNGIDTSVFDPSNDPDIAAAFSAADLFGKSTCRRALLEEVGLPFQDSAPVFGMVSRLSSQKGFDILLDAAPELFDMGAQLVVQGLGEPAIVRGYEALQHRYPGQFRLLNVFDPSLAQRVYAGSDAFLMPSAFEPCGLGQMIAMRYGTVPVVRLTGGLMDSVFDCLNGFTFGHKSVSELTAACRRAVDVFGDKPRWVEMQRHGMEADWGWDASAAKYVELYSQAVRTRAGHVMR
ncbi:MAG: glycogen synthase [Fimbriimonas sp.]|nr:glycogen synthase [Fimbriimonas sp.]